MRKNDRQLRKRREFVSLALQDNKRAAKLLREYALGIENCRTTSDVVYALQDILFLSERTIFNDFK